MSRADTARAAIWRAHDTLPEAATLKARKAAIDAAYPFGEREHHPYKVWLKERRAYLARYGYGKKAAEPKERP